MLGELIMVLRKSMFRSTDCIYGKTKEMMKQQGFWRGPYVIICTRAQQVHYYIYA